MLDGNDDVVDLGNPTALRITGSLTISAWINSGPFPIDDAAIVSKRGAIGFQFDTTIDTGPRTIGLKLTGGQGAEMARYGATALQPATWYHVAGVYDATARTMTVYLNGQVDNGTLQGTVTSSQQDSPTGVLIGQRFDSLSAFGGRIDDVRIYSKALTAAEVQTDMATGVGGGPGDTTPPTVSVTAPSAGATVSGDVAVTATAADNVAVAGVSFFVDGQAVGAEDTSAPYSVSWPTTSGTNGSHSLTARARDAAGNQATSTAVAVTVSNQAPPGGLVASYAFDEGSGTTAADASGGGITGTLANGATWGTGKHSGAVVLDGNDDVVDLGNPTALRITGSLTISAWINSGPFPIDDAAIVSKRGAIGFQFDTTIDTGPRTIGLKLTGGQGAEMARYGATALQPATWYHVAGVYDATARTMTVYLNGQVDNGTLQGTVTSSQQDSPTGVLIGQRFDSLSAFGGRIDDVRIYSKALTAAEVQTDMATGVGGGPGDTTPPTVSVTAPSAGSTVSGDVSGHRHRRGQRGRGRGQLLRRWPGRGCRGHLGAVLGVLAHHVGHQRLAQPDRPRP